MAVPVEILPISGVRCVYSWIAAELVPVHLKRGERVSVRRARDHLCSVISDFEAPSLELLNEERGGLRVFERVAALVVTRTVEG